MRTETSSNQPSISTSVASDTVIMESSDEKEQPNAQVNVDASTSTQEEVTILEILMTLKHYRHKKINKVSADKIHSGSIYCEKIRKTVKGRCVGLRTYGRQTIENSVINLEHP